MSWNGESRAIKEALRQETRVERELCELCKTGKGVIRASSHKYNRVIMICQKCADEWLRKDIPHGEDYSVSDQIYEYLYCDKPQNGNYRTAQISLPLIIEVGNSR